MGALDARTVRAVTHLDVDGAGIDAALAAARAVLTGVAGRRTAAERARRFAGRRSRLGLAGVEPGEAVGDEVAEDGRLAELLAEHLAHAEEGRRAALGRGAVGARERRAQARARAASRTSGPGAPSRWRAQAATTRAIQRGSAPARSRSRAAGKMRAASFSEPSAAICCSGWPRRGLAKRARNSST